jgi:hypothetical protein
MEIINMKNTITIKTTVTDINENPTTLFVVEMVDDCANLSIAEFSPSEFVVLRGMYNFRDAYAKEENMANKAHFSAWADAIKLFVIPKIRQGGENETPRITACYFHRELSAEFIGKALGNLNLRPTMICDEITQEVA